MRPSSHLNFTPICKSQFLAWRNIQHASRTLCTSKMQVATEHDLIVCQSQYEENIVYPKCWKGLLCTLYTIHCTLPLQQGVSPLSKEGASENLASSKRRDAAIFILLHCPLHCAHFTTTCAVSCAYFDCTILCIPCTVLSTALRAHFYSGRGVNPGRTRVQCLLDTRQPGACLQGFSTGVLLAEMLGVPGPQSLGLCSCCSLVCLFAKTRQEKDIRGTVTVTRASL